MPSNRLGVLIETYPRAFTHYRSDVAPHELTTVSLSFNRSPMCNGLCSPRNSVQRRSIPMGSKWLDQEPSPLLLTWDPAIAATRVALHSAVHDPAFIAHTHAIAKVATAFGLVPGSPARRAATQDLSEGWETLWLSSRRLDPDWGRTLQYWREHTMLVARPIYLATFLQALPSGHIPKNVARKIVEASFGALFEAGWTETVSILRRQTMWLHTAHRAACRGDAPNVWDRAYAAAFPVARDASTEDIAA